VVRKVIERHISEHDLAILRTTESSERDLLYAWADRIEDEE